MAVVVMGDLRAGVAAAYEHPTRHGHRAQAVLMGYRQRRTRQHRYGVQFLNAAGAMGG